MIPPVETGGSASAETQSFLCQAPAVAARFRAASRSRRYAKRADRYKKLENRIPGLLFIANCFLHLSNDSPE